MESLKLTKSKSDNPAVLGRLTGICADCIMPTRNGRKYTDELWEKVFKNDIVKERLENGGLLGELNHPEDRADIDLSKVAVCLTEAPKKNKDGKLTCTLDILDTPNGRILKTLADYGYQVGISSRGTGDVVEDFDGSESVDPNSYELTCWDIVELPAVKSARLHLVTEGLKKNRKTLKESLNDLVNNTKDKDERAIMEETISSLQFNKLDEGKKDEEENVLVEDEPIEKSDEEKYPLMNKYKLDELGKDFLKDMLNGLKTDCEYAIGVQKTNHLWVVNNAEEHCNLMRDLNKYLGEDSILTKEDIDRYEEELNKIGKDSVEKADDDIDVEVGEKTEVKTEAVDDGEDIYNSLCESLKDNKNLKQQLNGLQEKLTVSDTKGKELSKELSDYKDAISKLSNRVVESKKLKKDYATLETKTNQLKEDLRNAQNRLNVKTDKYRTLKESNKDLQKELSNKEIETKRLSLKLDRVQTKLDETTVELNSEIDTLRDKVNKLTVQKESLEEKYLSQIDRLNDTVTKYKKVAKQASDKYLSVKAESVGVEKNELLSRLNESYTFGDIDRICRDIKSHKLNVSKLPFEVNEKTKIKMTPSLNESITTTSRKSTVEDVGVDDLTSYLLSRDE